MRQYSLAREPRGQDYRDLLEFCGARTSTAILVVHEIEWLEEEAIELLDRLRAFQTEVEERSEWPGTRLLDQTASVSRYRVQPELIRILQTAASGLYEWQQPGRPEDLCFLRENVPLLVSVAHESDGYLDLEADEVRALTTKYPSLWKLLRAD